MASKQDFHKALTAIAYARVGWRDTEIKATRLLWQFELTPEQKIAVQNESDRARIWSAAWKAGQDALVNPDAVPVRNGEQPDYRQREIARRADLIRDALSGRDRQDTNQPPQPFVLFGQPIDVANIDEVLVAAATWGEMQSFLLRPSGLTGGSTLTGGSSPVEGDADNQSSAVTPAGR